MTSITYTNIAAEINRHHELACLKADEAVHHAVEAGKLLLQVKGEMKHGQFLPWLEKSVAVTPRQCQRYMAAAQGKPVPIRVEANATSVSHLVGPKPTGPDWQPQPVFKPRPGYAAICLHDAGMYLVEPSGAHPGYFFVSALVGGGETCTARPVSAAWVESNLQQMGLQVPSTAEWRFRPCEGVRIAMETMLTEETINARLAHKETIDEAIARMKRTNEALGVGA